MDKKIVWWLKGSSGTSYDEDYQEVLDKATALGAGYEHPSPEVKALQNQLMIDLKALGMIPLLNVFRCYAHDGGSKFGLINWIDPDAHLGTMDAGDLTWTQNVGFTSGNGTKYINDNFNPTTHTGKYTALDCCMFYYKNSAQTINTTDGHIRAAGGTNNRLQVFRNASGGLAYVNMNGVTIFSASAQTDNTAGLWTMTYKVGLPDPYSLFKGATLSKSSAVAAGTTLNDTLYNCYFGNDRSAFMGYGRDIRNEVGSLNTLMVNYLAAL